MTMNPRITYPLYIANQILVDTGTMLNTEVTQDDLETTLQWFLDPVNVVIFNEGDTPTMDDVKRAFVLLGAKVV